MTIKEMRIAILDAYPKASMGWRQKVTNMPTRQVVAIYRSLQKREEKERYAKEQDRLYHQMDIFEYMVAHDESGSHTQVAL